MSWPRVIRPPKISSSSISWSPTNKNSAITLSNNDLTAAGTFSTTGDTANGLGATAISTGNIYFELSADNVENNNSFSVGVGNSSVSFALGQYLGEDTNSFGFIADGRVVYNNSVVTTLTGYVDADVICFAVRFADNTIFRRINSGQWNDSGTADPSTNTGGFTLSVTGNLFPAYTAYYDGIPSQVSMKTSASFTIPSGFSYYS